MMIDSHCHPQFPQYEADREEVIKRTLAGGCGMICVGTDLEMSKKAIELAEKYDQIKLPDGNLGIGKIWATVGCHPNELIKEFRIEDYKELAKHPKVVGIGEIGLDYYRIEEYEARIKQQEIFRQFLKLSKELSKPIVIHCRNSPQQGKNPKNAYDDIIDILKNNPVKGVVHSFTGDFELACKFLDLGLFLGLNGIITFTPLEAALPKARLQPPRGNLPLTGLADSLLDMVAKIPLERILIETDAPYLAPVPYRGKRNEPLYVEFVARRIAEIKNISLEEVIEETTNNAKNLFSLD
jgi:TatD DNase family protein